MQLSSIRQTDITERVKEDRHTLTQAMKEEHEGM